MKARSIFCAYIKTPASAFIYIILKILIKFTARFKA